MAGETRLFVLHLYIVAALFNEKIVKATYRMVSYWEESNTPRLAGSVIRKLKRRQ